MVAFLILLSWTVQATVWFIEIILRITGWIFLVMLTGGIWLFRKIRKSIQERRTDVPTTQGRHRDHDNFYGDLRR